MVRMIYFSLILVGLIVYFIGFKYLKLAKNTKNKKQNFLNMFGINDSGNSMDNKQIYTVSLSDIGL